MADVLALLLTGVYGTGKTSVAEEIAELFDERGQLYAAIDLDWLCWSSVPGSDHGEHEILARNLASVATNYREAGAERFVLAGFVENAETLDAIRAAVGAPLTVIRLTAPLAVIEERLGGSSTGGRVGDLERARETLSDNIGVGLEHAVIENVGPLRQTALRVLDAAGWSASPTEP